MDMNSLPGATRAVPAAMEQRLIVALDVPTVAEARGIVAELDGIVSFFKIGMWLLFQKGTDALIDALIAGGKQVFLDAKMYDIGETVKRGVRAAAGRGIVQAGQDGDREQLQRRVAAPVHGGAHDGVVAMHGQDVGTHSRHRRHPALHRLRDVVHLGVHEHPLALPDQAADQPVHPRRQQQPQADLEERDGVAETGRHCPGCIHAFHVQRHNQAIGHACGQDARGGWDG